MSDHFYQWVRAFHQGDAREYPVAVCEIARRFPPEEWQVVVSAFEARVHQSVRDPQRLLQGAVRTLETCSFPWGDALWSAAWTEVLAGKLSRVIRECPDAALMFAAYYSANTLPTDREIANAKWERKRQAAQHRMDCAEWQKSALTALGYSGELPPTWAEANTLINALTAAWNGGRDE